MASQQCHPL